MFGFMVWIVIGGVVGWIASIITRSGNQQDIMANIVAGIVGSYSGGALLAPILHSGPALSYASALGGAIIVLGGYAIIKRRFPG